MFLTIHVAPEGGRLTRLAELAYCARGLALLGTNTKPA